MPVEAQMKHLFWRFWWAAPRHRFTFPGLYFWTGRRNRRVFPLPRVAR